jgi:(p)ppGpp synthase/HD superfamily hydrolase
MTTQEQLLLAARVAARAHAHQKRKDHSPYIAHPMRVALRLAGLQPVRFEQTCQAVALLHDVVEDTDVTFEELRELGFTEEVVSELDRVTKRPGEKYADFIERANGSDVSRRVKIADIEDNLEDQSALDPEEAEFLKKRYERALERLR